MYIYSFIVAYLCPGGSGRPYLPYRGDQLSPGQQVKVLAPGGGVAVARVIANQRGAAGKSAPHHHHHYHEDKVTVVLLCEPNRCVCCLLHLCLGLISGFLLISFLFRYLFVLFSLLLSLFFFLLFC